MMHGRKKHQTNAHVPSYRIYNLHGRVPRHGAHENKWRNVTNRKLERNGIVGL